MTSKERTAYWIRHHAPEQFASPSEPPSDRGDPEGEAQSMLYDSDGESTHSIPPKMLLKYGDGRPDIPISHWHHGNAGGELSYQSSRSGPRPRAQSQQVHHHRSRSEQPVQRAMPRHFSPMDNDSMAYPEEIKINPSHIPTSRPKSTSYAPTHHSRRSKSQPRQDYTLDEPVPIPLHPELPTNYSRAPRSIHPGQVAPQVAYSQSHPKYRGGKDAYPSRYHEHDSLRSRSPPAIVYAPGTHSKTHYTPPTLMHHGHGAPYQAPHNTGRYPPISTTAFPSVPGGLAPVKEDTRGGRSTKMKRLFGGAHLQDSRSPSPHSSAESGSTYYVLPSQGQKVQIIVSNLDICRLTLTDSMSLKSLPTGVCIQPHRLRSLPPRRTLAQAQVSGSKNPSSPAFSVWEAHSDLQIRVPLPPMVAADGYNVGTPPGQGAVPSPSLHGSDTKKKPRRMPNILTLTLPTCFVFIMDCLFLFSSCS